MRPADWLDIAAARRAPPASRWCCPRPTLWWNLARRFGSPISWAPGRPQEAGDLGAIHRPAAAVCILNAGDAAAASLGACRFNRPLELNRHELAALLAEAPPGLPARVMVGRMPLAFSALLLPLGTLT